MRQDFSPGVTGIETLPFLFLRGAAPGERTRLSSMKRQSQKVGFY
jgi:hypothetical protein